MKPEYEPVSTRQHLGYLIEECGEVLAAAGKSLRWGMSSRNPEITDGESNQEWLHRELNDLQGAIDRVRAHFRGERGGQFDCENPPVKIE